MRRTEGLHAVNVVSKQVPHDWVPHDLPGPSQTSRSRLNRRRNIRLKRAQEAANMQTRRSERRETAGVIFLAVAIPLVVGWVSKSPELASGAAVVEGAGLYWGAQRLEAALERRRNNKPQRKKWLRYK